MMKIVFLLSPFLLATITNVSSEFLITDVLFLTNILNIELYRPPTSTVSQQWLIALDENYNVLLNMVKTINAGDYAYFSVYTMNPYHSILLMTTTDAYNSSAPQTTVPYDTFVLKKCATTPYPFGQLAPAWASEPASPKVKSIGKCINIDQPNNPSAFKPFERNTYRSLHNCANALINFERYNDCPKNVQGDPHFVQTFVDKKTKRPINVCYDVTGQSQQSIFILQDHFTRTKVEGVLLDDYYMHKIKILHKGNLLKINKRTIEYKRKIFDLMKNGRLIFDDIAVDMEDDTIRVETLNGEHELITNIKKVVNDFGIEHFDVGFENMEKKVERYGGLLGDIGKKRLSILSKKVQDVDFVVLEIDNETIVGRLEKRSKSPCILLPFGKLIKLDMKHNYIY